jgi:chromosome segregation ATPase
MNLTPERLSEIEKRCNAATAGPWRYDYVDGESYCVLAKTNTISDLVCTMAGTAKDCDTADFIAHARTDIPDLLSEIKRLRERDSELTDLLDMAHDEFQRVEAHTDDTELQGIALRGQAKIRQNVPVIRQRDELENSVIKLNGLNDQLRAQLSDVTAQYKHCHNLYSERIECTNKLGRKVESLQAQLSDAQAALKVSKEAMETINRIERSLNGSPWKTLSEGIDACTAALKPRRE